jgi:hypothetical protein
VTTGAKNHSFFTFLDRKLRNDGYQKLDIFTVARIHAKDYLKKIVKIR